VLDGMWDGVLVGVLVVVLQMLGSGGGVACVRCVVEDSQYRISATHA
jgi:hypothetical protein